MAIDEIVMWEMNKKQMVRQATERKIKSRGGDEQK
jgi:hypothetical protein